jgi:hypothetical protein
VIAIITLRSKAYVLKKKYKFKKKKKKKKKGKEGALLRWKIKIKC